MRKVYICSPYRNDPKRNTEAARQYCLDAVMKGFIPFCPHIYFTQFLDDEDGLGREIGMGLGMEWLRGCDELWQYGEATSDMRLEIDRALLLGLPVVRKA